MLARAALATLLVVALLPLAAPPALAVQLECDWRDADCPGDLCAYDVVKKQWRCILARCQLRPCPLPP